MDVARNEEELMHRRKHLIRSSWGAVQLGLDVQATKVFYDHLIEQYPTVRPLFKDDMTMQYKKLYYAVSLAVDCLDKLDELVPVLQNLGRAHAGFGTVRAHYGAAAECFIWTLKTYILAEMPGPDMTNWLVEVAEAWEWALTLIGSVMADAGDEAIEERRQRTLVQQETSTKQFELS